MLIREFFFVFFLMIRRPPRSTRLTHSFPTRRSSDLDRKETLPASAIAKAVAAGRSIDVTHPFPLTIKRSIVNGSQRIELVGFPADRLAWLKAAGCFTEVIQYRTRVFVPVAAAEAILETVLEATT